MISVSNLTFSEFKDKLYTPESIKYEQVDTGIVQPQENAALQKERISFWQEKQASLSTIKLVSSCIAVGSSILAFVASFNKYRIGAIMLFLLGALSGITAFISHKRNQEATEQLEEWSISVNMRASAAAFTAYVENFPGREIPASTVIAHLFKTHSLHRESESNNEII
jgi:hypothetical protein